MTWQMFDVFKDEHPEVQERSTFFVTRKEGSCFKEAEGAPYSRSANSPTTTHASHPSHLAPMASGPGPAARAHP